MPAGQVGPFTHFTSWLENRGLLGLVLLAGLVHEPTSGGQFVPGFAAKDGLPQDHLLRAKTLKLGDSVESFDTAQSSPTSPAVPASSPANVKRSLTAKFSQFEHLPPEQWPDRLPDTPTPPPAKVSDGGEPKGVDPNKSPPAPPAPSPNHPSSKSGAMVAPSGLSKRPQPPAELPTPPATGKSAMYADGSYWKPLS